MDLSQYNYKLPNGSVVMYGDPTINKQALQGATFLGGPGNKDPLSGTTALPPAATNTVPLGGGYGQMGSQIKPTTSPDGAVSSSDMSTGAATSTAVGSAAGALGMNTMPSWAKEILDSNNTMLASGRDALKLSFDASLAANNQQYAGLFKELNIQHSNASEAGAALAAQLNPYSDPRIASTTGGYLQAIDQKYQAQAQKLQGQMNAAQQQLQAGYYEEYNKLVSAAQKENNGFMMDMQKLQLDMQNSIKQDLQFNTSLKQRESEFNSTTKTKYSDDYRNYLQQVPYSPEEIGKMTDEQILSTTAGRLATQAGLGDPAAIRLDMSEASYRSQQLDKTQQNIDIKEMMVPYQIANLTSLIAERELKALRKDMETEPNFKKSIILKGLQGDGKDLVWVPNQKISTTQEKGKDLVLNGLETIKQLETAYKEATGGDENTRAMSLFQGIGRSTKLDSKWESYLALREANATIIAKGIKMESGAPSNSDVDRAKQGSPSQWSSTYKAKQDFDSLRAQLKANLSGFGTYYTPDELGLDTSTMTGGNPGNKTSGGTKSSNGTQNRAGI